MSCAAVAARRPHARTARPDSPARRARVARSAARARRTCRRRAVRANHQRIDEEPHHAFRLETVPPGSRHADADIALAGIAIQQRVPAREQRGEQGHAQFARQRAKPLALRGAERAVRAAAQRSVEPAAHTVGGQFQHRVTIAERGAPVVELGVERGAFEPFALPQRVVAVFDRQRVERVRLAARAIQRAEFLLQNRLRPAIRHDVMQGQMQHIARDRPDATA